MIKNFRLVLLLSICLLVSFALLGCGAKTQGDYEEYADEESILKAADIIVVGEIIESKKGQKININMNKVEAAQNRPEDILLYTVSQIKVTDVIKGNVEIGDILDIKQRGDNGSPQAQVLDNGGYFVKGNENVFFLKGFENLPYSTLTPSQGHVKIKDGKTEVTESNKVFKNGVFKEDFVKLLKEKVKNNI